MEPLSPDDLLIRPKPTVDEGWFEEPKAEATSAPISLERFQALERVIRDMPINVDPYLELARIYLGQKRWTDAKRVLDLAVERFPESDEANHLCEDAQLNRSWELRKQAEEAHQAEPTKLTLEALQRSTVEFSVLKEKVCRQRLQRHPEQLELNLPLADALESLGEREKAIDCIQKAVVDPELRAKSSFMLGQLMERSKRIPEALSAYRRAAMFRLPPPPDDIKLSALSSAAALAEKFGLVDSAVRYVSMLCELQPQNEPLKKRLEELQQREL